MYSKTQYIIRSLSRGTNKEIETYIINVLWNKLNNPNFEFVTQQYVKDDEGKTRYIDMYFPQAKVAVEVDEWYHNDERQAERDRERQKNIETALLDSMVTDPASDICFCRIHISNLNGSEKTIEQLNFEIEAAAELIKKRTLEKAGAISWLFDEDERMRMIDYRGYIEQGDHLSKMQNILKIFGKEVKGWQKCTCWIDGMMIWSPSLSREGSDRGGWVNIISDDLKTIYESGTGWNGKEKKECDAQWDIEHKTKRVTFLKYKDALGDQSRRFLGVYMCTGYDFDRKAEVWELKSARCYCNLAKEFAELEK